MRNPIDPGLADARFPFPAYANGWSRVAVSEDVAPGESRQVRFFGRDLVVYRTADGAPVVLDLHCGAPEGEDLPWGRVEGRAIRCAEHDRRFAADGTGAEERVRAWPVCERNGFVFLHYDAEDRPPVEEVPAVPEVGAAEWSPFTRLRWKIRGRAYDMGENAIDDVHFRYLHGAASLPRTESGSIGGRASTLSKMKLETPAGQIDGEIESTNVPGMTLVYVRGICDTLIVITGTPIDGEFYDQMFSYTQRVGEDEGRRRLASAMLRDLERQMNEDIVVFEHKRHWTRPVLCDGDAPIMSYRKRARAQYSGEFSAGADEIVRAAPGRGRAVPRFGRREQDELASYLRSAFRARRVEIGAADAGGRVELRLYGRGEEPQQRLRFERACLERAEAADLRGWLARPLVRRRVIEAGPAGIDAATDEVLRP